MENAPDVRIELKMVMSITDVQALRNAAIEAVEREGVWHIGPDATAAQKQEEIDKIKADPAHAVSNLIAFMHVDDVIAARIPGLGAGSAQVAARVSD
ncbi:hypothetical protein ABZ897_45935 [Nonomuraea sp. NPDC046802]|uniref:hypothetical protein n=1 Tax=Nonomuraea sp. NPDC046802 TaxID=3154919 RepID=UPI0033F1D9CD